ncbi:MAG TPA: metallophosphoesterase [Steroidobacteraceae bacterium]|jgi:predicted phosphodiesterase|nr:metallophosphoesterase [Steroidobacteraceae bacterium]
MRIRVLSDLHLEYCAWIPPRAAADVTVLAGDIHNGADGIRWAQRHFPPGSVVYVPGNHEFYGGRMSDVLAELRAEAAGRSVHFLDAGETILNGVRFLGATLWTDFALYGQAPEDIEGAMAYAGGAMLDYEVIRGDRGPFRPEHSRDIHHRQVAWLRREIQKPHPGATVVVTHFLPHPASIRPKYQGYRTNPFFASDLDDLVRPPVSLWIHGHTHESVDAEVNGTRIVCNPRGLEPTEPNESFNPSLVVVV